MKLRDTASALEFEATLPAEGARPSWVEDAVRGVESGLYTGISPGFRVPTTAKLAGRLETRLSEEAGAAVGVLIPTPHVDAQLQADLGKLKGRLALVESTAAGWGEGRTGAPRSDWKPQRLGADPPAGLEALRGSVGLSIAAATGVPPALLIGGDSTGLRESFRVFLHSTTQPLARLILSELQTKLEEPDLTLTFERMMAGDITGRARALGQMVKAGIELSEARRLAGLE